MSFAGNILELILTFLIKELFSGLGFFTDDLGIKLAWQLLEYVWRNIGTNHWIYYRKTYLSCTVPGIFTLFYQFLALNDKIHLS